MKNKLYCLLEPEKDFKRVYILSIYLATSIFSLYYAYSVILLTKIIFLLNFMKKTIKSKICYKSNNFLLSLMDRILRCFEEEILEFDKLAKL